MAKYVYSIIIHPDKAGGYYVDIPDLQIGTQGDTIAECIDMARDAIGMWGICREDDHEEIPQPTNVRPQCAPNDIVTLVDIDFAAYRRANDLRTVHKNVSLPSWLCDMAEKANVNFSQVLQDALKTKLGANAPM